MSDNQTDRFALPLLQPGQAQKELWHNEALATIDQIIHPAAETLGGNVPPVAPDPGRSWIVGDAPTGAWAEQAKHLAGWTGSGWRFVAPREGVKTWVVAEGLTARFVGGAWVVGEEPCAHLVIGGNRVVGPRQAAIASPVGGAVTDIEARATLAAILGALQAHGLIAT